MNKKPLFERVGDFMAGKGFYIVLFLCVAAIGISGYYLFSSLNPGGDAAVAAPTQVVVTPVPTAPMVKPTVPPTPIPTPIPVETPSSQPTAAPTPAPTQAAAKKAVYTWPVKGEVMADFSLEVFNRNDNTGDYRVHTALDLAADLGAQVNAVADGTVAALEQDDWLGTVLVIDHADGLSSVYGNLAAIPTVEVGDKVTVGQVIGAVGNTALAERDRAAHLHFEMLQDNDPVDPVNYLPKR